ncbi:Sugar phosphate isomerase/epimerase [Paraburkholderia fungorum]|uniref:Sugar phosphate isomerase/epimerase n=1 Tax=Paraburkholderia fungorum TaxID=134537 RepID=A0A1H1JJY2_9BURK|nr:TIM barrel protein [Paraburkholderia fungorum]SDR50284.1 Sugar phosphate isomerase/epimerase [Paraburkholderia fungorum]
MNPLTVAPKLAVAHLTALELTPCELVRHAARAGFGAVGLRLNPTAPGAVAYPSLVGSSAHRELRRVLADEGVSVHDVEFIPVMPDIDVASFAPMFDAAADLGARCVTVSGDDPDAARLAANLAALCELAARSGLRVDLEFMRWRHVGTLHQARAMVERAGSANLAILVDALHLTRSGGSPADVRALPEHMVRAVQLCDASSIDPIGDDATILEARAGRLPPGQGALPLGELLNALPAGTTLGVEMPLPSLPADERLELAYRSTRDMLASSHYRYELSGASRQ